MGNDWQITEMAIAWPMPAIAIGFLMYEQGPTITSFFVESIGSGVPEPCLAMKKPLVRPRLAKDKNKIEPTITKAVEGDGSCFPYIALSIRFGKMNKISDQTTMVCMIVLAKFATKEVVLDCRNNLSSKQRNALKMRPNNIARDEMQPDEE